MNDSKFDPFKKRPNKLSRIKKVIAVISGKGGVGKSTVTSLLAVNAAKEGKKVAIIDADITGPSIPSIFGLKGTLVGDEENIYPMETSLGIKVVSVNLMVDDPTAPVIWRGPMLTSLLNDFWTKVVYGEIDELYIDLPPGTGDVPLTVFQSFPVNAIVIVSSPQELVSLIVEKALKMASMMEVLPLALVNNLAYLNCPNCKEKIYPYGKPHSDLCLQFNIPVYEELGIDPKLAQACDTGKIESIEGNYLEKVNQAIAGLIC